MKIPSSRASLGLLILLVILSGSSVGSAATEGWITSVATEESPLNQTAVEVTVEVGIRVQFDSPGYYVVLVREDSTGDYVAESIRYSVGAISEEKTVTLHFERPTDPGVYSYTVVLKMKDSSSGWFDADTEHFSIAVSAPRTVINITTVTQTETVTKALEYLRTVTETVTSTETTTYTRTQFNITTITILRTVTRNLTRTITLTRNRTLTKVLTVTLTPESPGGPPFDARLIGLGVIAVLVIALLVLALRRR